MPAIEKKFLFDKCRFSSCNGVARSNPRIMQKGRPNWERQDPLEERGPDRHSRPLIVILIHIHPKPGGKVSFPDYAIIGVRMAFMVDELHAAGDDLYIGTSAKDFEISRHLGFGPNIVVVAQEQDVARGTS